MTDTEIVDEILHKLKLANAGHFDRENMVDALDKIVSERRELKVDSMILHSYFDDEDLDIKESEVNKNYQRELERI